LTINVRDSTRVTHGGAYFQSLRTRPSSPYLLNELTQTSPTAPLAGEIGRLRMPNSHPCTLGDGIERPGKPSTHPCLLAEQAKTRFDRTTDTICVAT
jgi:hypothetical protein